MKLERNSASPFRKYAVGAASVLIEVAFSAVVSADGIASSNSWKTVQTIQEGVHKQSKEAVELKVQKN